MEEEVAVKKNKTLRVITGIIISAIALGAIILGSIPLYILMGFIIILCSLQAQILSFCQENLQKSCPDGMLHSE